MNPISKLRNLLEFKCLQELDDTKKGLISSGGIHAILLSIVATVTLSRPKPKEDTNVPTVEMIDRIDTPEAPKSGSGEPIQTVTASFIQNLQKNTPSVPQNDPLQDALNASLQEVTNTTKEHFNQAANLTAAPPWAPTKEMLHQRRFKAAIEKTNQITKELVKKGHAEMTRMLGRPYGIFREQELKEQASVERTTAKTSRKDYGGPYGYLHLDQVQSLEDPSPYPPGKDSFQNQRILLLTDHYRDFLLKAKDLTTGRKLIQNSGTIENTIQEVIQKLKENNYVTINDRYLSSELLTLPHDKGAFDDNGIHSVIPTPNGQYQGPVGVPLDYSLPMHIADELQNPKHDIIILLSHVNWRTHQNQDEFLREQINRFLPHLLKSKIRLYVINVHYSGIGSFPRPYIQMLEQSGGGFFSGEEFLRK